MTEIDYTKVSDSDRLRSIYPGDPVGDYYGDSKLQLELLQLEKDEAAKLVEAAEAIACIALTELQK